MSRKSKLKKRLERLHADSWSGCNLNDQFFLENAEPYFEGISKGSHQHHQIIDRAVFELLEILNEPEE